jgi:hypothetical protein
MGDPANYSDFFQIPCHRAAACCPRWAAAETAWDVIQAQREGAPLDAEAHYVVQAPGRRFRTKSGRASRRGPRGMGKGWHKLIYLVPIRPPITAPLAPEPDKPYFPPTKRT